MLRRLFMTSPLFSTVVVTALVFATSFVAGHAHSSVTVGQQAPEFSAPDTAGRLHRLSDFKGRYVVLEWTNPGCPFVRKHYESANMQGVQKDATARGVVWLAVDSTARDSADYRSPSELGRWMAEKGAAATATLMDEDGAIGKAYGARTTPHLYIVNPQGTLVYAGGIDSVASTRVADVRTATNYVRQGLNEALAGKPLTAATTRPYGCSIKYKS